MTSLIDTLLGGGAINRTWNYGEASAQMPLSLVDGEALLKGNLAIPEGSPPLGALFDLQSKDVRLTGCSFTGQHSVVGEKHYDGEIRPSQVWAASFDPFEGQVVQSVTLTHDDLGILFSTPPIKHVENYRFDTEGLDGLPESVERVWFQERGPEFKVAVPERGVSVRVSRTRSESSGQSGHASFKAQTVIGLDFDNAVSTQHALEIAADLGSMIAVLTLKPFSFRTVDMFCSDRRSAKLLWAHDRPRNQRGVGSFHEHVLPYMSPDQFAKLVRRHLTLTDHERVARRMMTLSLEAEDTLGRFIAIAQAFEVLARIDRPAGPPVDKTDFKAAVEAAKTALSDAKMPDDVVERLGTLMRSSNAESGRDALVRLMTDAMSQHGLGAKYPVEAVARATNKARNTLVHIAAESFDGLNAQLETAVHAATELHFIYLLHDLAKAGIVVDLEVATRAKANRDLGMQGHDWARSLDGGSE